MIKLSNSQIIASATEDEAATQQHAKDLAGDAKDSTASIKDDPKTKQDSD